MKNVNELRRPYAAGGVARLMSGLGPRIMLAPEGEGGGDDEAARLAAEQAAAEAAEREAAEKAAAEKAAAEKEAADKAAAEEAEKKRREEEANMTEAEKEKAKLVREVMEKKNKLKEEQAEKERLSNELKKFEGIDLEKVKELLEADKQREEKELERKGEYDRLKERIQQEREAEKKTFEEQIEALRAETAKKDSLIDELTIGQNFSSSTFIKDDLVLTPTKARQLYGSHFELQDGKLVAFDKPKGEANRTMLPDAGGNPLSFDEALKKIVEADPEKDSLLRSKGNAGAHSRNSQIRTPEVVDPDLKGASRISAILAKRQSK